MRKISGQLLSSKPVSLDRAAKILTSFASVENGSSATLSLYLQRSADAFTDLLQFHGKRSKYADAENGGPRRKKSRRSESESRGINPDEEAAEDLKIRVIEANPNEDKESNKKKKKKKKKSKSGGDEVLDS